MFLIWKSRVIWETHHLSARHFHFDTNLKKKLHGKIKCELFEFTYLPIWSWEDSLLKVVQLSNTVVRIAIPLNLLYLLFLRELHRMVVTEVYGMGKSWNKKLQYHWIFSTSSFWEAVTWTVCNWGYHGTRIAISSI